MRKSCTGFTLLELMVALALLSLLLVVLYGGLRLVGRGSTVGIERVERVADAHAVRDLLRRQLRQSQAVMVDDPERGRVVLFEGSAEKIRFAGPMLAHLGFGGLYEQRLEIGDAAGDQTLQLSWRPLFELDDEEALEPQTRVLIEPLETFEVEYFGAAQPGDTAEWQATWEAPKLPLLVRILIATDAGAWPELIVRPAQAEQ